MDMFGLYKVQILLLGLLIVPLALASKLPCFDEDKLEEAADRKLKHHYSPSDPGAAAVAAASGDDAEPECPIRYFQQLNQDISNRSISPWRYVRDTKEDRFPRTLVVAQCLCKGCIIGGSHSREYNSAPVRQSRVVLRKELCEDGKRYRLVPENVRVSVGCTCVKNRV